MEEKKVAEDKLPVEVRANLLSTEKSLFLNIAKFEHAQRVANMLANAKMWPDHIKSVGDALIIMNMADRMGADPFMLAQRVYIVHGKPGLEGKLVISLINSSGKYAEPLRFEFGVNGDASDTYDAAQDSKMDPAYGCRAVTVDRRSGKTVRGPKITWKIVKDEGWYGKAGSKWKTMAELMFQYRSASWFANIHCPEVTLGLPTADELRDIVDMHKDENGNFYQAETPKPITFNNDEPPPGDHHTEKAPRKPRSDKGTKRAQADPEQVPTPDPTPAPEPSFPPDEPGASEPEEPNVMTEEMLMDERRAELADLEKHFRYHVLEAKKRTSIAHPVTPAAYDELIRTVHLIRNEKQK